MQREAKRTLHSLTAHYQQAITENDYEVLVIDNGSSEPLDAKVVEALGSNFRYFYLPFSVPSPVPAINFAADKARGKFLGIFIDGARILSPGLLAYTIKATKAFDNPVVSTLGWHLGPKLQNQSMLEGYDQQSEDALLDESQWQENGYNLFNISVLAGSSAGGFFRSIAESNGVFVSRKTFRHLGGYDPAFDLSGGGLVNLDFYKRAAELPDTNLVTLLGEGTFHQFHGGVMTNVEKLEQRKRWESFETQYQQLRGEKFSKPEVESAYLGKIPSQAWKFIQQSVN